MSDTNFSYHLESKVGNAKAGTFVTPHGTIKTPCFMPVGTQGSVKSLLSQDLENIEAEIILGNTYHLYLRPGSMQVSALGGIHGMSKWSRPILTDSGGYQVSSLGLFKKNSKKRLTKIDEDGVTFKSHINGSTHYFTPEKAIQIQEALAADVIMAFDEATPEVDKAYAQQSMERTHRWLDRCIAQWKEMEERKQHSSMFANKFTDRNFQKHVEDQQLQDYPELMVRGGGLLYPQALFGIIQGGNYPDLRRISAEYIVSKDLPGIAVGGATIGQNASATEENVSWIRDILPDSKPLYLMGVGVHPQDAIAAIISGADMFDCVAPTKLARTGILYHGQLEIPNNQIDKARYVSEFEKARFTISWSQFADDERPILENCGCYTCKQGYSRAYLRHLYKAKELSYHRLASIHNIWQMVQVCKHMREAIVGQKN